MLTGGVLENVLVLFDSSQYIFQLDVITHIRKLPSTKYFIDTWHICQIHSIQMYF